MPLLSISKYCQYLFPLRFIDKTNKNTKSEFYHLSSSPMLILQTVTCCKFHTSNNRAYSLGPSGSTYSDHVTFLNTSGSNYPTSTSHHMAVNYFAHAELLGALCKKALILLRSVLVQHGSHVPHHSHYCLALLTGCNHN